MESYFINLSKNESGLLFEKVCKNYLKSNMYTGLDFKHVYLYKEVPAKLKKIIDYQKIEKIINISDLENSLIA